MVPLVADVNEFKIVRELIVEVAEDAIKKAGLELSY